jgi:hypothetical protein
VRRDRHSPRSTLPGSCAPGGRATRWSVAGASLALRHRTGGDWVGSQSQRQPSTARGKRRPRPRLVQGRGLRSHDPMSIAHAHGEQGGVVRNRVAPTREPYSWVDPQKRDGAATEGLRCAAALYVPDHRGAKGCQPCSRRQRSIGMASLEAQPGSASRSSSTASKMPERDAKARSRQLGCGVTL